MGDKQLKLIRRNQKIEFWYESEFYTYERHWENGQFSIIISRDDERIYGPKGYKTELGEKMLGIVESEFIL